MRILVLLCLVLVGPVWADDRETLKRMLTRPGETMLSLNVVGDWAYSTSSSDESGGYRVLRKLDGKWRIVSASGGALDPAGLFVLGAPTGSYATLLGYPVQSQQIEEARNQGPYWTWKTCDRALDDSLLDGMSFYELTLARNEIFAVHGRPFKDPLLRAYFRSRAWYHENPGYTDAALSAREKRNAAYIADYQKRHHLQW